MSWPLVNLSAVCQIDMGSAPKGSTYVELDKGVPLIAGAADYGDVFPRPKKATLEPTKLCEEGDIIICVRATIGDLNWADKEYCLGRGVAGLRVHDKKLDSKYLWYFIASIEDELYRNSTGSTFPQINKKIIEGLQIPLPPLETQKQIAAVLEKADQLRKDCKQMEQELNSLAQSVFIEMFGDPVTNPKCWKTQMLGSISKVQLGKMLSSASKNGINAKKYLRNANVKWRSIEIHDLLEMDFTDKETGKFQLITGDLLVCEGGEIGRCAIWTGQVEDCYYQKALHRVRLNPDLATAEYIQEYFFWMAKLGGLISSTNEVTFKHLTAEKMNKLVVPLPPIEAQRKFKNIYSSIQSELENNTEQMAQTEMGFNSLMQKAFNGELNLDNAKPNKM
jgi:type I restriction enzyme S subunit